MRRAPEPRLALDFAPLKLGWILGAAATLLALPALAEPVTFRAPAGGETLVAGSVVTVRWDGVPGEAHELEILVSVDGGRSLARLGREVDGRETSLSFTVPNLPAARAVLVLRYGVKGKGETLGGVSAPFAIVPAPGVPFASLAYKRGELWVSPETPGVPLDGASCETGGGSISPLPGGLDIWEDDASPKGRALAPASEPPTSTVRLRARASAPGPVSRQSPAPVPLRI